VAYLVESAYAAVYGSNSSENIPSPAHRHIVDPELAKAITADPVAWIGTARQNIVTLIRRAAQEQSVAACWGMACTSFSLLEMGRYFDECRDTLNTAMAATQPAGDHIGHAALLYRLGTLKSNQNDDKEAIDHHQQAAEMFESTEEVHRTRTGQAGQRNHAAPPRQNLRSD
jgi:hypothetical protein